MKDIYKKNNIVIKPVSVCDMYEIGDWAESYPWIKLGFLDSSHKLSYFDTAFYLIVNKTLEADEQNGSFYR